MSLLMKTLKPQGLWPQMSHPTDPRALQGSHRGHEPRNLIFESFEFWNVGNVMFTVSPGINFQRFLNFSGWAHLSYARSFEGGTLSESFLSSLVLENHCSWEKKLFFQDVISCKRSTVTPFFFSFYTFHGVLNQEYWNGLPCSSSGNHVSSDSMDMSLSKLQEMMKDRETWRVESWAQLSN